MPISQEAAREAAGRTLIAHEVIEATFGIVALRVAYGVVQHRLEAT